MSTQPPSTETVWSQLSGDLRRFIRRRVADEHAAEDLLQETFVRIHHHIHALADADRLTPWVYRIARNVVHDHYRRRPNRTVPLDDANPVEERDDGPEQCHSAQWLEELISQLPETYRDAVRLSEIGGLTQQAVADRLRLSLSAAKSRIQRGRAMFKDVLEQCCRFEFDRRGNLLDIDPRPERTVCRDCD